MRATLSLGLGVLILLTGVALPGCSKKRRSDDDPGPVVQQPPNPMPQQVPPGVQGPVKQPPPPPRGIGVAARGDTEEVKGDMRTIAQLYQAYHTEFRKSPPNQKAFMDSNRQANALYRKFQSGQYKIVPNVRPASGIIVAYEAVADQSGHHVVAMGDGAVDFATTQELRAQVPEEKQEQKR